MCAKSPNFYFGPNLESCNSTFRHLQDERMTNKKEVFDGGKQNKKHSMQRNDKTLLSVIIFGCCKTEKLQEQKSIKNIFPTNTNLKRFHLSFFHSLNLPNFIIGRICNPITFCYYFILRNEEDFDISYSYVVITFI